jgi:hypothetical protein
LKVFLHKEEFTPFSGYSQWFHVFKLDLLNLLISLEFISKDVNLLPDGHTLIFFPNGCQIVLAPFII